MNNSTQPLKLKKQSQYFTTLIIALCFIVQNTNAQTYNWANGQGGKGLERAWDIAQSKDKYYITGQFTDTMKVQDNLIPSSGSSDIFLVAHDKDGKVNWARTIGGKGEDISLCVDCDTLGNAYISGYFKDTLIVNNITHIAKGWELFIAKYNSIGDLMWFKSYKGTSSEIGYGLEVSKNGNIWVAGWFQDTLFLNNNIYAVSYGGSDIFNAKFDTDGNPQWIKHAGRESVEYGYKVSVDENQNSYITGVAGFGSLFETDTMKSSGVFIAAYDANGDFKWVNSVISTIGSDVGVNSISVSENGKGYIAGRYSGTANFDTHQIISYKNTNDPYFASFDLSNGEWTKAVTIKGSGNDKNRCVYADDNNNIFVGGSFNDSLWINNQILLAENASEDIFAFKYNTLNEQISLVTYANGSSTDVPTDILADGNSMIVGGFYTGTLNVNNTVLNSQSSSDMNYFMYKVSENTAINDIEKSIDVKLFPNPLTNIKQISLTNNSAFVINGHIIDVYGKEVFAIDNVNPFQTKTIDLNMLCSGIYFVVLKSNNDNILKTEKLIIGYK